MRVSKSERSWGLHPIGRSHAKTAKKQTDYSVEFCVRCINIFRICETDGGCNH
jgi:hypothetical protein